MYNGAVMTTDIQGLLTQITLGMTSMTVPSSPPGTPYTIGLFQWYNYIVNNDPGYSTYLQYKYMKAKAYLHDNPYSP